MKQRRYWFFLPLIVFVLWAADAAAIRTSPIPRPRIDFFSGVCGDLADTVEPQVFIPVGCETALCCPGCPDAPIDWRIRVSGEPLESTLLNFENLSPEAVRKLRIKGKARWEGSALRVWPGETVISGFTHDPRVAPPIATPRLFANRESLRKLREAADREEAATRKNGASLGDRPLGRMEVFVEQMMGKYQVSEARVASNVKRCSDPLNTGDRILINNNISTDNTITLLDARDGTGTCLDDKDYRGAGIVNVGDLRPLDICTSETAIFSDDNGMFFLSPTIWTDSHSDEHIMNLPTMFRAPVAVWIVINESGAQERAERDMANANFIYNDQKVGFAFDATYANALPAASFANKACAAANQIRASNFFRPDRINVYYIDNWTNPDIVRGQACWNDEDNKPSSPGLIFVNRWAPPDTLSHEFGHVFSLDDLGNLPTTVTNGIGNNNIMAGWTAAIIRSEFTIGQSFRMNVNSISMINVNGVRAGWSVRSNPPCFDATTSNRCPALARDVTPK